MHPSTPAGSVRVRVPASAANLGPGFDSVGLGLDLWDRLELQIGGDGVQIECTGEGAQQVPRDDSHLVVRAMRAAWTHLGVPQPSALKLRCHNEIPHSRGLGSSAAAIVAGVAAGLESAGVSISGAPGLAMLADLAADLEGHPDNSSASVYGGLTISWREGEHWPTAVVPVHPQIHPVVLVPAATLATQEARAALPPVVAHADAARNSGRAALLVQALSREPQLLLPATHDWLHQEHRRRAYPDSMAVVDLLREQGLAATISGAGPTVLVLIEQDRVAQLRAVTDPLPGWRQWELGIAAQGVQAVASTGVA